MGQISIFENDNKGSQPLAARMRPRDLDEFAGQQHLLGQGKLLRRLIESDQISSMIFWGPPGVGKTTLARIIAARTKSAFVDFSAVTSGIREIRKVMEMAEQNRRFGERTILFVDEIHRFNKAQQDAFLPFVEKGSIILIGATTENPSFEINSALMLPVVLAISIFARPIVSIFFPEGYVGEAFDYAFRYARIFAPLIFVQLVNHILHAYLRGIGKVKLVLWTTLVGGISRVALTLWLIPLMNLEGVFLAEVLSWGIDALICFVCYVWKYRTDAQLARIIASK